MAKSITREIGEIGEINSDATYISAGKELIELIEDEEDIREGLIALADEEGTITWEQYQCQRADKESQGGLSC